MTDREGCLGTCSNDSCSDGATRAETEGAKSIRLERMMQYCLHNERLWPRWLSFCLVGRLSAAEMFTSYPIMYVRIG